MSEPLDQRICAQCGAIQDRSREKCWLCDAEVSQAAAATTEQQPARAFSFSLATLLLIITLVSICLGLFKVFPGVGVIVSVLMIPVFVRTARVVRHREAAGLAVSKTEKVTMFLGSFGVASIVAVVLGAATFTSFCGVCLVVVSAADRKYGGSELFFWGLGMCAIAAGAIKLIFVLDKWIRRRYRRDIGED